MKKNKIKKCFFQIFRPKNNPKIDGVGDCSKCKPDENTNKKCKNYQQIEIEGD
jgi:hypothetical protein